MDPHPLDPGAPFDVVMAALLESERAFAKTVAAAYQSRLSLTHADFFALGVARRATANSSGFRAMVDHRNSLCALAIVRMQLDTALRLYAGFFAPDHREFCRRFMDGEQVNQMRADDGKRMSDGYLRDRVAKRHTWMTDVYAQTSGFIHMSVRHVHAAFQVDEDDGLQLVIGPSDHDRKPEEFHEPARCMVHLAWIIDKALADWLARMCESDGESIGTFRSPPLTAEGGERPS